MRHPRDPDTHRSAIARRTVLWKKISSQPRKQFHFDFTTIQRQLFSVRAQFTCRAFVRPDRLNSECFASNLGLAAV